MKVLSSIIFLIIVSSLGRLSANATIPVSVVYEDQETALEIQALRRVEEYFRNDSDFQFVSTSSNRLTVTASLLQNVLEQDVPLVFLSFEMRPAGRSWGRQYVHFTWSGGSVTRGFDQLAFDTEGKVYLNAIFQNWTEPSFDQFDRERENIKANVQELIRAGQLPRGSFEWLLDDTL